MCSLLKFSKLQSQFVFAKILYPKLKQSHRKEIEFFVFGFIAIINSLV